MFLEVSSSSVVVPRALTQTKTLGDISIRAGMYDKPFANRSSPCAPSAIQNTTFICKHKVVTQSNLDTGHIKLPHNDATCSEESVITIRVPYIHHVLSNCDRDTYQVDSHPTSCHRNVLPTYYNVSVDEINTHLKAHWLEATHPIDASGDFDQAVSARLALAEHRAVCDGFSFHAYFCPPQIRALRSGKAIFIINVEAIDLYLDENSVRLCDLKVAIVADIEYIEDLDRRSRYLRINFEDARYCKPFSSFSQPMTLDKAMYNTIRAGLVAYLTGPYLAILQYYDYDYIYRFDDVITEPHNERKLDTGLAYNSLQRIPSARPDGLKVLTTLTQRSINGHFHSLRETERTDGILSNWHYNGFRASFDTLQVRLPGDPKAKSAILYVTMRSGYMTCIDPTKNLRTGHAHEFSNWRLAFEVKIIHRMSEKNKPLLDGFLHGRRSGGKYMKNQLYFDFQTATLRLDLSHLPGLLEEPDHQHMREQYQSLSYYLSEYLKELGSEGYHVLCSFPSWHNSTKSSTSTLHWQFCGKRTTPQTKGDDENMLVIYGSRTSTSPIPTH